MTEINARFDAVDARFDEMKSEMNTRFVQARLETQADIRNGFADFEKRNMQIT